MIKSLKFLFICIFLSTAFISCSDDDDDPDLDETRNLYEIVNDTDDLSTLFSALELADLDNSINGITEYTILAPTNSAFQDLLDSNDDWNALSDIPSATLNNVLKYHIIPGEVESDDLSDMYVSTLATAQNSNLSLQVTTTGGVNFDGSAIPVTTDIDATNGVIHKIDRVMLPNNVVEFAQENDNFSILVEALTDSRHTTDFLALLTGDGPLTVLAPTNEAFTELLNSNASWNNLGDIPIEVLDAVLKYHVVSGVNLRSSALTDNLTLTFVGGKEAVVDLSDADEPEVITESGQDVDIIMTDIQGTNGVIHAIDEVMLPNL